MDRLGGSSCAHTELIVWKGLSTIGGQKDLIPQEISAPVVNATSVLLLYWIKPAFLPEMVPAHKDKSGGIGHIPRSSRMPWNDESEQIPCDYAQRRPANKKLW